MKVIGRLTSEHPAYREMSMDAWGNEHAATEYVIEGKGTHVSGVGI